MTLQESDGSSDLTVVFQEDCNLVCAIILGRTDFANSLAQKVEFAITVYQGKFRFLVFSIEKPHFNVENVLVVFMLHRHKFVAPDALGRAIDCRHIAVVPFENLRSSGYIKTGPAEPVPSGIDALCRVIQNENAISGYRILWSPGDQSTDKLDFDQGHVLRFIHYDATVRGLREPLDSIPGPNPFVSEWDSVAFTQLAGPEF